MPGDYRPDGPPIAAGPALTTCRGDAEFDRFMGERRFEDMRLKAAGRLHRRAEPLGASGSSSGLTQLTGSPGVSKRAHMPKDGMR